MKAKAYDQTKLEEARKYLRAEFPEHQIAVDQIAPNKASYFFRLDDHAGRVAHRLFLSGEFVDDQDVALSGQLLRDFRTAFLLRHVGNMGYVVVTNHRAEIVDSPRETFA